MVARVPGRSDRRAGGETCQATLGVEQVEQREEVVLIHSAPVKQDERARGVGAGGPEPMDEVVERHARATYRPPPRASIESRAMGSSSRSTPPPASWWGRCETIEPRDVGPVVDDGRRGRSRSGRSSRSPIAPATCAAPPTCCSRRSTRSPAAHPRAGQADHRELHDGDRPDDRRAALVRRRRPRDPRRREGLLSAGSSCKTKRGFFSYEPIGVVGVIAPWNYPWSIPFGEVAIALMAGNGVVLKPASLTPLLGERIQSIFDRAGFPEGLVRTVHGGGAIGQAICEAPGRRARCSSPARSRSAGGWARRVRASSRARCSSWVARTRRSSAPTPTWPTRSRAASGGASPTPARPARGSSAPTSCATSPSEFCEGVVRETERAHGRRPAGL